jgi:hypothetical protein
MDEAANRRAEAVMRSVACREYLRAANFVRRRAASEDNPNAKEILHDIERSYNRLVEIESWLAQQQRYGRPFAHFRFFEDAALGSR